MIITDYLGNQLELSSDTIVLALNSVYSVNTDSNYSFSAQGNRSSEISKTLQEKNFEIVFKSADVTGTDQKKIVTFFQKRGLFSMVDFGHDYDDIDFYTTNIDTTNTEITVYCRSLYPVNVKIQKQVLKRIELNGESFSIQQNFSPIGSYQNRYTAQVEIEFKTPQFTEGSISFSYKIDTRNNEKITYTLQSDGKSGNYAKKIIIDNYDEFLLGTGTTKTQKGIFKRFTSPETIIISGDGFSGATMKIIKFSIQDI